jgi:phospholipid-translocating ATPase
MRAMNLCHNVTPTYGQDESGNRTKEFQAASPDEIALVKFAEEHGLILEDREETKIVLSNTDKEKETYHILNCFPFSSESKRMGIIMRHIETNKIMFYVKGADAIMLNKVKPQ